MFEMVRWFESIGRCARKLSVFIVTCPLHVARFTLFTTYPA